MASRQDRSGQWRWRKQIRLPDGRKIRGSGTAKINTKVACDAAERAWIAQVELENSPGYVPPIKPRRFRLVAAEYLEYVVTEKAHSTWTGRAGNVKNHLLPVLGDLLLEEVDLAAIDGLKRVLKNRRNPKLMVSTVNLILSDLSNILHWSFDRNYLRQAIKISKLSIDKLVEIKFFLPHEAVELIARAPEHLRPMIQFAVQTGLRIGELVALEWTDIDRATGVMTVRHNRCRGRDRPPKGKTSRSLRLSKTALAALREQRLQTGFSRYVFGQRNGKPYSYTSMQRRAKRLGFTWHMTRHTYGTTLAANGVAIKTIMERMGHAKLSTTQVYLGFAPVHDDHALAVLDDPQTWSGQTDSWQNRAKRDLPEDEK